MHNRRSPLAHPLGKLAIGAALVLISSVGAQATDAIDDPIRQPHLKSWSNVIPNADRRFIVLADFNNAAVLDRETGLVWEKSPDANTRKWQDVNFPYGATTYCVNKNIGGRVGWRLPSVVELKSVQDPTLPAPFVPGTVFTGIQASYWSATSFADNPTAAWLVLFFDNPSGAGFAFKANANWAWCVRGPMNADQY